MVLQSMIVSTSDSCILILTFFSPSCFKSASQMSSFGCFVFSETVGLASMFGSPGSKFWKICGTRQQNKKWYPPPRRSSHQTFGWLHPGPSFPTWGFKHEHKIHWGNINRGLPYGLGLPAYPAVPKMDFRPPLKEANGGGRQAIRRRQSTHSVFTK